MATEYPYNGRISRWEEIAEGLAIVGVEALDAPFAFEPGQYATLGLMGDPKLVQRPMSISSSADDTSEYEFFIRLVHGGAFTPLLWERRVGDAINIKGPKGKFLLQDDGRRCLFVATGTGLAPFMSMIDTLRGRGRQRDIWILHGVSYEHDLAWREELSELAAGAADGGFPLHYAATISRPGESQTWKGLTGRAEAVLDAHLDANELTADNTTIYLCGNPDMVSAVEEIAERRGFAPEQVRKELYWPKGRAH
jgi:ferredoxin/flavodoxin---NADP+ reductase